MLRRAIDFEGALGIASKLFNALGYFGSGILVGLHLSPTQQGLFFTFLSFATLSVAIELGLNTVVIQFTSHEIAAHAHAADHAERARAQSRVRSVGRFAFGWFWSGALLFLVLLSVAGFGFFHGVRGAEAALPGPWLALVALVSIDIALFPVWSLLEGAGRIRLIYGYRAGRAIALGAATWVALIAGAGLWSLSIGYVATLPFSVAAFLRGRRFLYQFATPPGEDRVGWGSEMLPLQWRLAVSWLAGYLVNWAITPLVLKMFGPELAGQVGMSWSAAVGVSAIATGVLAVKFQRFGALVAVRNYSELDRLALRQGIFALLLAGLGAVTLVTLLRTMEVFGYPLVHRFLPLLPTVVMMAGATLSQVTFPMAYYLRAHKQEPYMWLSIAHAAILFAAVAILGRSMGAMGIAIAYFGSIALVSVPFGTRIFLRKRLEYQAAQPGRI